jgi:predicted anti-sigma-YlaC factor YlaD
MLLLLGMSLAVLAVVGNLIGTSVAQLLTESIPGRIAVGVILLILALFAGQMRKIQG